MREAAFDLYWNRGRMAIIGYLFPKEGRVMEIDMHHLYIRMRTSELEQLRSMHIHRLNSLQNKPKTYHVMQDIRRVEYRIRNITVELEARKAQLPLDLK